MHTIIASVIGYIISVVILQWLVNYVLNVVFTLFDSKICIIYICVHVYINGGKIHCQNARLIILLCKINYYSKAFLKCH